MDFQLDGRAASSGTMIALSVFSIEAINYATGAPTEGAGQTSIQPRFQGIMKKQKDDKLPVVSILGTDNDENLALCRLVHNHACCYRTAVYTRLPDLSAGLAAGGCMAVILNLDSIPMDNRTICRLATSFPNTRFFCASSERLHPDLKDAITQHLFACLTKPIDPDELHFFLKSVRDDYDEYLEDGTHAPA